MKENGPKNNPTKFGAFPKKCTILSKWQPCSLHYYPLACLFWPRIISTPWGAYNLSCHIMVIIGTDIHISLLLIYQVPISQLGRLRQWGITCLAQGQTIETGNWTGNLSAASPTANQLSHLEVNTIMFSIIVTLFSEWRVPDLHQRCRTQLRQGWQIIHPTCKHTIHIDVWCFVVMFNNNIKNTIYAYTWLSGIYTYNTKNAIHRYMCGPVYVI